MKKPFYLILALCLLSCEREKKTNEPLEISSEVQNVSIYGASDGAISVTIAGGQEPYGYEWSNGSVTKDLTDIPAGIYSLTVTDADGDFEMTTDTVSEPSELLLGYVKEDVTAVGENNGSITLTISGGISPYTINWSNGATESAISELAAGLYTVTVTDAVQAEVQEEITLLAPLTLTVNGTNVSTYNGQDGIVDLLIEGGLEPFTIQWSDGSSTEDLTEIQAGFYKVTVTDANASVKQANISVYEAFDLAIPEAELLADFTRLKQAGMRINYHGDQVIYIDPINLYEGQTGDADIILITHAHTDHYDADIITQLITASTTILVPPDLYSSVVSIAGSADVIQIAPDSVKTVYGIEIEVVPAYNSNHILPNSVGYIFTLDGLRVYHTGDTKRIPEMTGFSVDIACLPMGQNYTFSSIQEATDAARDLGASVILPIHYGMYEGTYQDPWTFKDLVEGEMEVCVKPSVLY